jgi:hypothetical protein
MTELTKDEEKIIEAMAQAMREAANGIDRIEPHVSLGLDGLPRVCVSARTDAAYLADARRQYAAYKAMMEAQGNPYPGYLFGVSPEQYAKITPEELQKCTPVNSLPDYGCPKCRGLWTTKSGQHSGQSYMVCSRCGYRP